MEDDSSKLEWAQRFAVRLRGHWARLTPEEAVGEGRRLYALLSQELSAEAAADAIAAQWGDMDPQRREARGAAAAAQAAPTGLVIVEDDQTLCEVLKLALEGEGFVVWAANNAIEGLSLIARHQPQALLTDLNMHGMDGAELAKVAREYADGPLTVVMITGAVERKDVLRARASAADHLLHKPVGVDDLLKVLPAPHPAAGR